MKLLSLLMFLVLSLNAFSAPTPFNDSEWSYFKQLKDGEVKNGEVVQKVLKYEYDFGVTNAAAAATLSFEHDLPAGAIVHKVTLHIPTVIVSASDNTIAITCESAGDLLAAKDFTDDTADTVDLEYQRITLLIVEFGLMDVLLSF